QFLDGTECPFSPSADHRLLRAVHLAPSDFPSEWGGLAMADAVVVNGAAWTALDASQRRALRQWVEGGWGPEGHDGGRAILCGDLPGEWQDADAASLIAVRPERPESFRRLECLAAWTGSAFSAEGGGAVLGVTG